MIKACLQIYRELLSFATFLRVHSNSKEVSYFYWQNSYPNLKAICDIKAKFFLWNKLLESLLLAKYLISVASTLNVYKCIYRNLIERKCHYYIYLIPFVQYSVLFITDLLLRTVQKVLIPEKKSAIFFLIFNLFKQWFT